jgi:two-component system response regulator YesN
MFKVLIIDDEALIAKGLQSKIAWEQLECKVCGVATDGLEGQRLIDELKPDIVISDIVMPGNTGLELAEYIYFHFPEMVTIILTAHDKFKYAQQAIKYGVKDYILKPIDKNEIIKAVKSAVVKLKKKEYSTQNISKLETIVNEVRPLITTTLLFDITLNGNNEIELIKDKLEFFDINIGKGAVIIFQVDPQKGKNIEKLHYFAVKSAVQNIFAQHKYDCAIKEIGNRYIVLPKFDITIANNVVKNRLIDISREIQLNIRESLQLPLSAGIGECYRNIYELHQSYEGASNALGTRFFMDSSAIIHIDEIQTIEERNYYFNDNNELYQKVKDGDEEAAIESLERILSRIKEIQNERYVKGICINIVEQLNELIDSGQDDENRNLVRDEISTACTFADLKNYLRESVKSACQQLKEDVKDSNNNIIDKALKIIHERYFDKKLSLQSIANELDITFYYLSRLFKKEMNTNFMDYLTNVRIDKAKELLDSTELKNAEIADKVGFYDYRYFSQVFRKKCKMTPTEYRQKSDMSKN